MELETNDQEILKTYKKYAEILKEELEEVSPIAWAQGWRSQRIKEIKEIENKIKEYNDIISIER